MLLSQLLSGLDIKENSRGQDPDINGIAYDSRQVDQGFLFVAVEGFQTDGHLYIEDAVKRGAAAVVIQKQFPVPGNTAWVRVSDSRKSLALIAARYYDFPCSRMKVTGVTGTNGKTTTTHMLKAVYGETGIKTGLVGTLYNQVGEKTLPVERTTPESLDLQKLAAAMAGEQVKSLVMEVSSHALVLHRVAGCDFHTAVFTNITQDHLDFHRDMQDYLEAKKKLFTGPRLAVVNADSRYAREILDGCTGDVVTYGVEQDAVIKARDISISPAGVSFTAVTPRGSTGVNLQLTGLFNVYNALAAFAAGYGEGIAPAVIKRALEKLPGVPGRFELVNRGQDFTVIVDYAHTPDGLENILSTAREITRGRLVTVFGCGGDRDRTKRPLMGEIGAKMSDFAVITSDNPRSEDPGAITEDIVQGVRSIAGANYKVIVDRRSAIRYAIETAGAGDVIIIAGKGHETYQEIKGEKIHFDDREEAGRALEELGGATS